LLLPVQLYTSTSPALVVLGREVQRFSKPEAIQMNVQVFRAHGIGHYLLFNRRKADL
jgi:hypothetical protein